MARLLEILNSLNFLFLEFSVFTFTRYFFIAKFFFYYLHSILANF